MAGLGSSTVSSAGVPSASVSTRSLGLFLLVFGWQERRGRRSMANNTKVIRGGSWNYLDRSLRCSFRNNYPPALRLISVGFRLAGKEREKKHGK